MKTIAESTGLCFRLCISLFLFISLAFNAQAHDPGLSSAIVTVGDQQINVLLGFAQKDIESMLAAGTNPAGAHTSEGYAAIKRELEALAANEFSLYRGGTASDSESNNRATKRRPEYRNFTSLPKIELCAGSLGFDAYRKVAYGSS